MWTPFGCGNPAVIDYFVRQFAKLMLRRLPSQLLHGTYTDKVKQGKTNQDILAKLIFTFLTNYTFKIYMWYIGKHYRMGHAQMSVYFLWLYNRQ